MCIFRIRSWKKTQTNRKEYRRNYYEKHKECYRNYYQQHKEHYKDLRTHYKASKFCLICGKPFLEHATSKGCCSKECRNINRKNYIREEKQKIEQKKRQEKWLAKQDKWAKKNRAEVIAISLKHYYKNKAKEFLDYKCQKSTAV